MSRLYAYIAVMAILLLITLTMQWLQVNYIGDFLNKPMTHGNCTIKYECSKSGVFDWIGCGCTYFEENCRGSEFAIGCSPR